MLVCNRKTLIENAQKHVDAKQAFFVEQSLRDLQPSISVKRSLFLTLITGLRQFRLGSEMNVKLSQ